ncbi:N-acetylglucosamine kinase [Candidatus Spyradosoma sp. SGI.093]|uniref:N-acetylglucosamine kinase n=1 Tax=Candidatus Spyradosoma sp. SGI.093 TaxID=3420583 RepID=UPI003D047390
MKYYIGIDGGGTKTRALAVSEDGICRGYALAGASNPNSVGAEKALENLHRAVVDAAKSAGTPPVFETGFFGISGVNDSVSARALHEKIAAFDDVKIANFRVENDTRSLCAATFGTRGGIVLIAGTGSKCYGRSDDGREWETGGYDFHVSDEGGAFDLARRGLTAAVRAADGRGEPTSLKDTFFRELQISEVGQISQRLHQDSLKHPGEPMSKDEIAALAVFLDEAYLAGDAVAKKILEGAMDDLATMVETVARRLDMPSETLRLGITGGVILNEPCATIFRTALEKRFPRCEIVRPKLQPVVGAAIQALALGGVAVTPEVQLRLGNSFRQIA